MPKYLKSGYLIKILPHSSNNPSSSSSAVDVNASEGGGSSGGGSSSTETVPDEVCFECKTPYTNKGFQVRATYICDHVKCFNCIRNKSFPNHCTKCVLSEVRDNFVGHRPHVSVKLPLSSSSSEDSTLESEISKGPPPPATGETTTATLIRNPTTATTSGKTAFKSTKENVSCSSPGKKVKKLKTPEFVCPFCQTWFFYQINYESHVINHLNNYGDK